MTRIISIFIGIGGLFFSIQKRLPDPLPPFEVYVVDIPSIPNATGKAGSTYTAEILVVDNTEKKVFGPYRGSSYPNSKEIPKGSDKPNTLDPGIHLFNNEYGHKGGTVKGLNLIDEDDERLADGFSWLKKPTVIQYANVHTGFSDKGNFNSRGSMGCITIHPKDVDGFFDHFDFSNGTKGTSHGVIYIYREDKGKRNELINQIIELYN